MNLGKGNQEQAKTLKNKWGWCFGPPSYKSQGKTDSPGMISVILFNPTIIFLNQFVYTMHP